MSEQTGESTWRLQDSEQRIQAFRALAHANPKVREALRAAKSVSQIVALSETCQAPLKGSDIALHYSHLDEDIWPWFGLPKQDRRHFVHKDEMARDDTADA